MTRKIDDATRQILESLPPETEQMRARMKAKIKRLEAGAVAILRGEHDSLADVQHEKRTDAKE
jgi:hypothetical protein